MLKPTYDIPSLPLKEELETVEILRALKDAHRFLAELKGRSGQIPNQGILIDTLSLQEAKASSEIENYITTQDELFRGDPINKKFVSANAKEVEKYGHSLRFGFDMLNDSQGLITNNTLIGMFRILKETDAGFRVTPGTTLKSEQGDVVYVPPQDARQIATQMQNLEGYINDPELSNLDPLVKMAIIHHQFESIHPFSDGNGRIGRILNVLYLTQQNLLETPVLYLSRYITANKSKYYRLLQETRDSKSWSPWILFMLDAVRETSKQTIWLIGEIKELMAVVKRRLREDHKTLYSQDLINNLFRHPYTRIDYVVNEVGVGRQAAGRYLNELSSSGLLEKVQYGKNNYYVNRPLVDLLVQGFGN